MPKLRWSTFIPLIVAFSSCATMNVNQDYDSSTDFSSYRNFAWLQESQKKTGDIRIDNPLIDSRVREAVDRTLTSRGYRISDDAADFYVAYHLSLKRKLDLEPMTGSIFLGRGYYGSWGGIGVHSGSGVTEYEEGTLVIDVNDAKTNKLVWRGWASRRVREHSTPEQTTDTINKAVAEILAQFPPQQ